MYVVCVCVCVLCVCGLLCVNVPGGMGQQHRSRNASYSTLLIVQQKDLGEANMLAYLIEDRAGNVSSYVDFLCSIHSQIQVGVHARSGAV